MRPVPFLPCPAGPLLFAAALLLQACGAPHGGGLFRGDRVTVDRDFIYLDDPVFLQSKSVYGERLNGYFAFQLPIFFNADPRDTLRFAPGGAAVGSATHCLVDTGETLSDPAAVERKFQDTARTLLLPSRHAGSTKVDLNFYCKEYHPEWGRTDTLSLAFRKKHGAEAFQDVAFSLPFHVSYRGPVVSILVGLGLLYAFTQVGWWIAGE